MRPCRNTPSCSRLLASVILFFAGPVGAQTLVHTDIADSIATAELSMRFEGSTATHFWTWRQAFRAKLQELLGDTTSPEEWQLVRESQASFEDHVRYDLLLKADGVPALPLYLLIPRGASPENKAPAVLCIHGHGDYGHHPIVGRVDIDGVEQDIADYNYDYGRQFVRRGYVVVAPCMIPFGRRVDRQAYRGNDPCAVTFVRMQALGRLPIAANLRDLRWSLDLLESRPEVDPTRIGCAGLSTGGRMTMMVSAIDDRIRVAAVSGALNLMQERMTNRYTCGSQVIPGLLRFGDYSEIGSLIAPRPCVWETGSEDGLIVPVWDDVFRGRLRRAYQAVGAADQLYFDRFSGGHSWSGKIALPLFDSVLKVAPADEEAFPALPLKRFVPPDVDYKRPLYRTAFDNAEVLRDWRLEGGKRANVSRGKLVLESDPAETAGELSRNHLVLWLNRELPPDFLLEFSVRPQNRKRGLNIIFFNARGVGGESIFAPTISQRDGTFRQYHSGDLNSYHVSYWAGDRGTANLRKNRGFHLVATGKDLVAGGSADEFQTVRIYKRGGKVRITVDDVVSVEYDDDAVHGPVHTHSGWIGLRQMGHTQRCEYDHLAIYPLK